MTPAARTQAAIELLDAIIASAAAGGAAADTLIARYFATRRYAGSKDRRAVRELVYAAIRQAGPVPASGRAAVLALADLDPALAVNFDGSPHGPAPIDAAEPRAAGGVAPAWLVEALGQSGLTETQQAALIDRAPLDVRINSLATTREAVLAEWPDATPTPLAPLGLRLPNGTPIEQSDLYRAGLIEVQDEGSQLVGAALAPQPGEWLVDLCAGGGGKTLQIGAAMDAPCSGTGTWRRNPEARWRLTPERLDRLRGMQAQVMSVGADLVKPGGRMVYVVCSLLDAEGSDQIAAFLESHPGWSVEAPAQVIGTPHGTGYRLDPATHGTDGFFVACLRAPC